jgi:hypothetical protein
VLEDAEGDPAGQPGGELAAAREAEHEQLGAHSVASAMISSAARSIKAGRTLPVALMPAMDSLRTVASTTRAAAESVSGAKRGIDAWRNVGDTSAQCLWVLRD